MNSPDEFLDGVMQKIRTLADYAELARAKARARRRREKLRNELDRIFLGRSSPIILKPTTADSEEISDQDRSALREAAQHRLQKIRKIVKKGKRGLRIDLRKSGSFPPMTEEQSERMEHCKEAMVELSRHLEPEVLRKVERIRRVVRNHLSGEGT